MPITGLVSAQHSASPTLPRSAARQRLSGSDCLRSAIAGVIFELVWTIYHGSGFAPGELLREWCVGFLVGLCITLGERVLLEALARGQHPAKSQTPRRLS
jgi:hypothetical protein